MRVSYSLILAAIISSLSTHAQVFEWAKSFGSQWLDNGQSIATDLSGNVYTAGRFQDLVDFNPGPQNDFLATVSTGPGDGYSHFIQKMDAAGNFLWARSVVGSQQDNSIQITTDVEGNVVAIGHFSGTAEFGQGLEWIPLTSNGGRDVFIIKLDSNGDILWAKSVGGALDDYEGDVTVDSSGNVFVTGYFRSSVDFDPGQGVTNLTSSGSDDAFILKLDASGEFLWARSFGGALDDRGYSVAVHNSDVIVAGSFYGTADFDPGPETLSLTSAGETDNYVMKLDGEGNLLWAKSYGGNDFDSVLSPYKIQLAVDAPGNIYSVGDFAETVDFDPGDGQFNLNSNGDRSVYIQKLDFNGNFLWAKSFGGESFAYVNGITIDDDLWNIYTVGTFTDTIDLEPGTETANFTSTGAADTFIQKLDSSGNLQWAVAFGSAANDQGNDIAVAPSGHLYTTGEYYGAADFNPGVGQDLLSSVGYSDIFVQKLGTAFVSVHEQSESESLRVYPNPSDDQFSIDLGLSHSLVRIRVTDLTGKLIQSNEYSNVEKVNLRIDGPEGMYFVFIETSGFTSMVRVTKKS